MGHQEEQHYEHLKALKKTIAWLERDVSDARDQHSSPQEAGALRSGPLKKFVLDRASSNLQSTPRSSQEVPQSRPQSASKPRNERRNPKGKKPTTRRHLQLGSGDSKLTFSDRKLPYLPRMSNPNKTDLASSVQEAVARVKTVRDLLRPHNMLRTL